MLVFVCVISTRRDEHWLDVWQMATYTSNTPLIEAGFNTDHNLWKETVLA